MALPALAEYQADLLGGIVQLTCKANLTSQKPSWEENLYQPYKPNRKKSAGQAVAVKCIPYYAWANRAIGGMQVWHLHN